MNDGFTLDESRNLFGKCLNVAVNQLPEATTHVHQLCSGHPMLISLIGSLLEDSRELALNNEKIWNSVITQLKNNKQ